MAPLEREEPPLCDFNRMIRCSDPQWMPVMPDKAEIGKMVFTCPIVRISATRSKCLASIRQSVYFRTKVRDSRPSRVLRQGGTRSIPPCHYLCFAKEIIDFLESAVLQPKTWAAIHFAVQLISRLAFTNSSSVAPLL